MFRSSLRRVSSPGRWALACSLLLGLLVAPFALATGEGNGIKGGQRNPTISQRFNYVGETQFMAKNNTWSTRQSNKGSGGSAIYGCRTVPGANPCLKTINLTSGRAFEFQTDGAEGGYIDAGNGGDTTKPFTTNATGVATGLNADRVDSKSADEISGAAVATVQAGLRFAAVAADGTLGAKRGVDKVTKLSTGTYEVLFTTDASACAFTATETQFVNAGAVGVELGSDKRTVTVRTRSGGGADGTDATPPTDRPFHLVATCV